MSENKRSDADFKKVFLFSFCRRCSNAAAKQEVPLHLNNLQSRLFLMKFE